MGKATIAPDNLTIKIELRDTKAVMPSRANQFDAGLDLTAISQRFDAEGYIEYDTGVAIEIPKNYVGLVYPRSSISKYGVALCNSVGVIDHGYVGTIKFRFYIKNDDYPKIYNVGDRIGQIIIQKIPMITLEQVAFIDGDRSGFGSTGV